VVGFRVESRLGAREWVRALNAHLPQDIVVTNGYRVTDDFRIRKGAVSREYRYCIHNRSLPSPFLRDWTCFVPQRLDVDIMDESAKLLCGEHDFSSFVTSLNGVASAVRTVRSAGVQRTGDLVLFGVTADSFLPHQIRNTIGLLIRLGLHKTTTEEFRDILAAKRPGLAGPMSPARGLYLTRVNYPRPLGSDIDEDLHS
ncbi:MAG: tRNA pseudouridine(38-40) synthase TruA, partial [Chloroflexota bacterium]